MRPKGRRCQAGLRLGHAVKGPPGISSLATHTQDVARAIERLENSETRVIDGAFAAGVT